MKDEMKELIGRLREISAQGFVPSMRSGPTGVGYTLESLLGIQANSSKVPDFKGIEIKVGRISDSGNSTVRTTLFSRVPDWKASRTKNAHDLVMQYGYVEKGRQQLYCSIGSRPNTFGLCLHVDAQGDTLHVMHRRGQADAQSPVVQWSMPSLRRALQDKHPASCFVKAKVRRGSGGEEEFCYTAVTVSDGAAPERLGPCIQAGYVELDFVVHLVADANGGLRARDHGYLFKTWQRDLDQLFPSTTELSLA